MADTKAKFTLNGDAAVELDMLKGTLGQDVTDIRTLGSKGMFTLDPGSTLAASCESRIAFINGDEGILPHRGFPIDQLTTGSNYLEVCYILLNDEEPTQEQHNEFKITVTCHTMIHEQITRPFYASRRDSHPMVVICGITGALAVSYHDSLDVNNLRHREIAASRLLSKMSTMAVVCYKRSTGQPFVYPRNDLSHTGNFLNMVFSTPCEPYKVNPILERAMDRILILHVGHEQNVSTFAMRIAGSLGTNPFVCIATGIVLLWGPVHGGANEAALKVLEEISSVKHIPEFVRRAKGKNGSFCLMGFGHRMYKNYDPRITIMRETCHGVLKELGIKDDLLEVAMELENTALSDPYLIEKRLYSNIGFYSGIIPKAMGIPPSMFTVISVMARTVDWIARWSEMHNDGTKITRSCQLYIGYEKHDFKSDIKC